MFDFIFPRSLKSNLQVFIEFDCNYIPLNVTFWFNANKLWLFKNLNSLSCS